jgi:hypothetical protein
LLDEVTDSPFPEETKKLLLARVKAVELTLPLLDLDHFDGRKECSESMFNAIYQGHYNKITVCTGMFNSLQSEAAIYIILAHELSHSVDPGSYISEWSKANALRTFALRPLIGLKTQPLSCGDWDAQVEKISSIKIDRSLKPNPYDNLASCLENGKPLKKAYDAAEIDRQVDEDLVDVLNYAANRNLFTSMVIPTFKEFNTLKKNPYFRGPEVIVSEFTGKGYSAEHHRMRTSPYSPEIFYQVISCEHERAKSTVSFETFFTNAGSKEREQILKASIEKTKKILSLVYEEYFAGCGQYCQGFVRKGMARNVDERFADWMSFRILNRYLKSKENIDERRILSAFSVAYLCDKPSFRQEAGALLDIENTYSIESHPENRARRMALYNTENSELLQCAPETLESWGSCPFL